MKTTHLIALTATIVACTATTASARPIVEPSSSQISMPSVVTPGGMAAHRDQVRSERSQLSQTQPAAAPLTDRTATDSGLPIVLVLLGVTVPLGLAFLIGRPILGYARHRHHPTSVA